MGEERIRTAVAVKPPLSGEKEAPALALGDRVLVDTPDASTLPATVVGFRAGLDTEDFERVDVVLDESRVRWLGCHPKPVRRPA